MSLSKNPHKKVIIIDQMHESILEQLQSSGFETTYLPKITKQELIEKLPDFEVLVLRSKIRLEKEILKHGSKLRLIARAGAGLDEIDESFLKASNITLINAPEGNRDAVGEHTIGMLLCLFNHLHLANQQVKQKIWDREGNRGLEVKGKTIAIIGYGNMGKAVAKRLSGFGCEVIAYDKYRSNYGNEFAKEVSMKEVYEKADVVTYHIPLNAENRGLVTPAYLDQFRKPVFLLNLARGEVIPFASVCYGIEKGIIRGAALDVLENEKLETLTEEQDTHFQFLAGRKEVLFSPHVGGWTFESYQRISEVLASKITDYFKD